MTVIRKDLGTVTAYAYAVSKGYTGTEAEFAELMASYAEVAEEAAQSASAAAASASAAAASAASLTVDSAMSDSSTNPVQNRVITSEITDVKSALDTDESNIYDLFDISETVWTEGKQLVSNGTEIANENASVCKYIFAPKGSRFAIVNGYKFNVATYSAPLLSTFSDYRTFGTDEYVVPSDCYVKVSIKSTDETTPVTATIAKSVLKIFVFYRTKAEKYKNEVQQIYDLDIPLENGTIYSDGTPATVSDRVRSSLGIYLTVGTVLRNTSGIAANWRRYTDADCTQFDGALNDFVSSNITIPVDGYYKFVIQRNNHSNGWLSQYFAIDNNDIKAERTAIKNEVDEVKSWVKVDESNIYNLFDAEDTIWTEGKRLYNTGAEGNDAKASVCMYIFSQKGSRYAVASGYKFNIATYSLPLLSSMTDYRALGTDDYVVSTDCYVKVSILNLDGVTPVTSDIAKTALKALIISSTKAEAYKHEVQSIVNLDVPLETGTIKSDGTDGDATGRIRSTKGLFIKTGTILNNINAVSINWRSYNDAACTQYYRSGAEFTTENITIPDSKYYRFIIQKNHYVNGWLWQYLSVDNNNIQEDHTARIEKLEYPVKPLAEYPVIFPPSRPYLFNGTMTESFIGGTGDMLTPLYALYDAFVVAHPHQITSEVIGQDASGTYDIRAYTIRQTENMSNAPVILWLSNIHASEPYALTSTYQMAKELLENHDNDDVVGFLWRNCIVKIVPVCNPWGLANGGQRYNSNGVNLNRDFPANWEYSDVPYDKTGDAPASQAETQAIMAYVDANKANALFAVTRHDSNFYSDTSGKIAYTADDFKIDMNVLRTYYRLLQTTFLAKYSWIYENLASTEYSLIFQNLSKTDSHGTMDKWFNSVGVHGCLLEVTRPKAGDYTESKVQDFLSISLEMNVNMIASIIQQNRLVLSNDEVWYKYS